MALAPPLVLVSAGRRVGGRDDAGAAAAAWPGLWPRRALPNDCHPCSGAKLPCRCPSTGSAWGRLRRRRCMQRCPSASAACATSPASLLVVLAGGLRLACSLPRGMHGAQAESRSHRLSHVAAHRPPTCRPPHAGQQEAPLGRRHVAHFLLAGHLQGLLDRYGALMAGRMQLPAAARAQRVPRGGNILHTLSTHPALHLPPSPSPCTTTTGYVIGRFFLATGCNAVFCLDVNPFVAHAVSGGVQLTRHQRLEVRAAELQHAAGGALQAAGPCSCRACRLAAHCRRAGRPA